MEKVIFQVHEAKMTRYGKYRVIMEVHGDPEGTVYWLYPDQFEKLSAMFAKFQRSTRNRVIMGVFDDEKGYYRYAKLVNNAECFFERPEDQDLSDLQDEGEDEPWDL